MSNKFDVEPGGSLTFPSKLSWILWIGCLGKYHLVVVFIVTVSLRSCIILNYFVVGFCAPRIESIYFYVYKILLILDLIFSHIMSATENTSQANILSHRVPWVPPVFRGTQRSSSVTHSPLSSGRSGPQSHTQEHQTEAGRAAVG